jgi:hypothetical protein
MTTLSVLQAQDIASFLDSQRNKPILRFITHRGGLPQRQKASRTGVGCQKMQKTIANR